MTNIKFREGFTPIATILIIIAILAIGLGYFAFKKADSIPGDDKFIIDNQDQPPSTSETSNWKTYHNEKYRFEFKYPSQWTILSDKDLKDINGNLRNVILNQESSPNRIVVAVYEDGISPENSYRNVHSITNTTSYKIGNITATKLSGYSGVTGNATDWVIYNLGGKSFIMTAPTSLLNSILPTFKFL